MGDDVRFISIQDLIPRLGVRDCPSLIDVRRAEAFESAADMIPGAAWRDPAEVEVWAHQIPADADVVVYCVHGHEVSQGAAATLRRLGRSAVYLEGGLEGYRVAGGDLIARPDRAE